MKLCDGWPLAASRGCVREGDVPLPHEARQLCIVICLKMILIYYHNDDISKLPTTAINVTVYYLVLVK